MAETIIIGCKLPHGLVITDPNNKSRKVTLNGLRDARIIGSTFATTEVPADLWATWKVANPEYRPLKTGALFEAKNSTDAAAKGKELSKEKTGFEPMKQTAPGITPADKK